VKEYFEVWSMFGKVMGESRVFCFVFTHGRGTVVHPINSVWCWRGLITYDQRLSVEANITGWTSWQWRHVPVSLKWWAPELMSTWKKRQVRRTRRHSHTTAGISAVIPPRLDYCNSLLFGFIRAEHYARRSKRSVAFCTWRDGTCRTYVGYI